MGRRQQEEAPGEPLQGRLQHHRVPSRRIGGAPDSDPARGVPAGYAKVNAQTTPDGYEALVDPSNFLLPWATATATGASAAAGKKRKRAYGDDDSDAASSDKDKDDDDDDGGGYST
jgi:hypothetical protein